jgi:hypothetical protein
MLIHFIKISLEGGGNENIFGFHKESPYSREFTKIMKVGSKLNIRKDRC